MDLWTWGIAVTAVGLVATLVWLGVRTPQALVEVTAGLDVTGPGDLEEPVGASLGDGSGGRLVDLGVHADSDAAVLDPHTFDPLTNGPALTSRDPRT